MNKNLFGYLIIVSLCIVVFFTLYAIDGLDTSRSFSLVLLFIMFVCQSALKESFYKYWAKVESVQKVVIFCLPIPIALNAGGLSTKIVVYLLGCSLFYSFYCYQLQKKNA
jgi:hypothetical protein